MEKLHASSRLSTVWDGIRTSLWFVPSIMMALAGGLAAAGSWADFILARRGRAQAPWWAYFSTADDARDVLSTLLSSMIAMTSLVFSVTIVVLSLAANQFGPRLIRNFMASPQTQTVLGIFVMTILYCLIVLSLIGWRGSGEVLPFTTVTIAIVLMAASVVLLVFFIHILARSIVSETVIERVGRELDAVLGELAPLQAGAPEDDPEDAFPNDAERRAAYFGPRECGYIQAVEFERLVAVGRSADVVIGLRFRPGDYVSHGGQAIAVHPGERACPAVRKQILDAIVVGAHRTPVQDPEYPIRHLVEIAVRALSPGTNDPYTAVAVVHRLSDSLARLAERALPPGVFRDDAGVVRVVCPRPSYMTLTAAAFDQIRQNAADKPIVLIHLLEALARIAEHVTLPAQVEVLRQQLRVTAEDAEREIASPADRADVRARVTKTREAIESGRGPI